MKRLGFFAVVSALIWPVSLYASDPAICAGAHYIWVERKNSQNLERDIKQRELEIESKKIELNEIIRFKLRYANNTDVNNLSHAYEGMNYWISNAHSSCQRMFDTPSFPQGAEHIFHVGDVVKSRILVNDLRLLGIKYQEFLSKNENETIYVFQNDKEVTAIYPIMMKFINGYYGYAAYALGVNPRNSQDDGGVSSDASD